VWSVQRGSWNGTALDGLNVIAVIKTDGTLGNVRYEPRSGEAVLVVDARANAQQREALASFARSMAGGLIGQVVDVKVSAIQAALGTCDKSGCATVKAGELVEISTRCLGGNDHFCGNEFTYYPPLTAVNNARPALTELAAFRARDLGVTWETSGQRGAFLGTFGL
jgi:hypothetical protein